MAPSRKLRPTLAGPARGKRKGKTAEIDGADEVFRHMLAEVESSEPRTNVEGRARKRRRVGERVSQEAASNTDNDSAQDFAHQANAQTFTLDSDESEESDIDWEDVGVGDNDNGSNDTATPGEISVVLNEKQSGTKDGSAARRRPVTSAERNMRLVVHKIYVCCLLYHNFLRNSFCNDHIAQVRELVLHSQA